MDLFIPRSSMTESRFFVKVLVVLTGLWTLSRGDAEVFCGFSSSCLLPCVFQVGPEPLVHWIYVTARDNYLLSYYDNQEQLGNQDQRFRGRTSLFQDQLSRGNASLLLRGVKVQDEGRYKCYTSTTREHKESFLNLKTEAPVSEVIISQEGNRITCSSEGIYPEPELFWSTLPPFSQTPQNKVHQTEEQLYYISSDLMVPDNADWIYSCTVRTQRSQRRTTLNKPTSINGSETATIPCSSSDVPVSNVTWRFNHSQLILTKAKGDYRVSEEWTKQVKEVSESGNLTLQSLSSAHDGVYTCEVRNEEETIVSHSFLRISTRKVSGNTAWIVPVAGAIICGFVVLVLYFKKLLCFKQGPNSQTKTTSNTNRSDADGDAQIPENQIDAEDNPENQNDAEDNPENQNDAEDNPENQNDAEDNVREVFIKRN